jgi:hypothetical protein
VELPVNAKLGRSQWVGLVQRRADSGKIAGGMAVIVNAVQEPPVTAHPERRRDEGREFDRRNVDQH